MADFRYRSYSSLRLSWTSCIKAMTYDPCTMTPAPWSSGLFVGQFCINDNTAPQNCPSGTYNLDPTSTTCTTCPAGSFCPSADAGPDTCDSGISNIIMWSYLDSLLGFQVAANVLEIWDSIYFSPTRAELNCISWALRLLYCAADKSSLVTLWPCDLVLLQETLVYQ